MHPPGETLRRIRMELGLPLSKVARQSQLSVARIEALEAGDDAWFSEALALARAYGMTIDELAFAIAPMRPPGPAHSPSTPREPEDAGAE